MGETQRPRSENESMNESEAMDQPVTRAELLEILRGCGEEVGDFEQNQVQYALKTKNQLCFWTSQHIGNGFVDVATKVFKKRKAA